MGKRIRVLDTTLRDGEQAPGYSMNLGEKLEMARQLERLKVDIIEAGFPASSPEDFQSVSEIARLIRDCSVTGLCRCTKGDIEQGYEALRHAQSPIIHTVIATSDIHLTHKLKMNREQNLQRIADMVAYARSLCPQVQFSAEDAFRSNRQHLMEAVNTAVRAGATVINITDTVGFATPAEMEELFRFIRAGIENPEVLLSVHCHNDLGMAVANSLAAISAGADQIEGTINGIGERAGNAALEELVMALKTRGELFGADCRVDTRQIYRTSKMLCALTGQSISSNKAVVGRNAFAHESGIHQHGVMAERSTYEIMSPADIGLYQNNMVLGKHSGKHAFVQRLGEIGYVLGSESLDAAFEKFKVLADRKKVVTDRDMEAIVESAGYAMKETYTLESFVINSGTIISATAVVKLSKDGESLEHVARGEGPIDASFKAIDRIVKRHFPLKNYSINAVTEGEDALGEVVVKIEKNGQDVTGRGLSTDILEASIKAYINAINKALID